jgi:hypothetical protein
VTITTHHLLAPGLSIGINTPLPPLCACLACHVTAFTFNLLLDMQ